MYSINCKAVTENKRAHKECLANQHISAILNNQIQRVSETRLSSLAMTSVPFHWLTAKPFVLLLYNCDTTRMVGRPVNSTAIFTSLLNNTSFIDNKVFFPRPTPPPPLTSLHFINPPHIPRQPTSH